MYVWEVRENAGYDGILWSVLIMDDDNALEKIKREIISHYNTSCNCNYTILTETSNVKSLEYLEEYMSFEFGRYSDIEVIKTKVI